MNLNEFLIKLTRYFPPEENIPTLELVETYERILKRLQIPEYQHVFDDFLIFYKYKKFPTLAELNKFCSDYEIKETTKKEISEYNCYIEAAKPLSPENEGKKENKIFRFYLDPKESLEQAKKGILKRGLTIVNIGHV